MNVIVTARQQACADESSVLVSGLSLRRQLCVWFVACVHVLHLHAGQCTAGTACWMWTLHQKSKPRVDASWRCTFPTMNPCERTHTRCDMDTNRHEEHTRTHTLTHLLPALRFILTATRHLLVIVYCQRGASLASYCASVSLVASLHWIRPECTPSCFYQSLSLSHNVVLITSLYAPGLYRRLSIQPRNVLIAFSISNSSTLRYALIRCSQQRPDPPGLHS